MSGDYSILMETIEALVAQLPVNELRADVLLAESQMGQHHRNLPSGNSFDNHTKRARLWLDFLDDLEELRKES